MDNVYLTALAIAFVFMLVKFIDMRYVSKENKPLKVIIIDTIVVYFSVLAGSFIIDQFGEKTKGLTEAPVFVDRPKF
jgi:hypothetical protein